MCYPFEPYSNRSGSFINIAELPLAVMDVTLFNHMNLDAASAMELIVGMIGRVSEVQGVMTILWHNNNMHGPMGEFYEKIISLCSGHDAWFATGSSLVDWYRSEGLFARLNQAIKGLQ